MVKGEFKRCLTSLIAGILGMRAADLRNCLIFVSFVAGGAGTAWRCDDWQNRKENERSELRVRFQEVPQFADQTIPHFPNSSLVHHDNLMTIIDERMHYHKRYELIYVYTLDRTIWISSRTFGSP